MYDLAGKGGASANEEERHRARSSSKTERGRENYSGSN